MRTRSIAFPPLALPRLWWLKCISIVLFAFWSLEAALQECQESGHLLLRPLVHSLSTACFAWALRCASSFARSLTHALSSSWESMLYDRIRWCPRFRLLWAIVRKCQIDVRQPKVRKQTKFHTLGTTWPPRGASKGEREQKSEKERICKGELSGATERIKALRRSQPSKGQHSNAAPSDFCLL